MSLLDFKDNMALCLEELKSIAGIIGCLQSSIDQSYVEGLSIILEGLYNRMKSNFDELGKGKA